MTKTGTISKRTALALAAFLAAIPAGAEGTGVEVFHPPSIVAGAWQVPIFVHVEDAGNEPVRVTAARREGASLFDVRVEKLPAPPGSASFVAWLDDPLLMQTPGGIIDLGVMVGDSMVHTAEIPLVATVPPPRLVTVGEGGDVIVWEGDGCGSLYATDTLDVEGGLEEALVTDNAVGGADIATVSGGGEVIVWRKGIEIEERFRVSLGGHASSLAPIPGAESFLVGFLDGRIFQVGWEEGTVNIVSTVEGIPAAMAVGEVDGDGEDDLVASVLEMDRSLLLLWRGDGTGRFESAAARRAPLPCMGRDLAFARAGGEEGEKEELLLLLDGGRASLSSVMVGALGEEGRPRGLDLPGIASELVRRLLIGDFNADGRDDVGLLHGTAEPVVQIFLRGDSELSAWAADLVPVGGSEVGVAVLDLDRNGADDLIVGEGAFRIWLNDGRGRLIAHPDPPAGRPARLFGNRSD